MILKNTTIQQSDYAIPLETFQSSNVLCSSDDKQIFAASGNGGGGANKSMPPAAAAAPLTRFEITRIQKRAVPVKHGQEEQDVVTRTFGPTHEIYREATELLIISDYRKTLQCQAFIYQDTFFMTLPEDHYSDLENWNQTEFFSSMTQLIELAEEKTSCSHLVAIVDSRACNAKMLIRALMYIGFQLTDPRIYRQAANLIFLGYEL